MVLEEAFVEHGPQLGLGLVDRTELELAQVRDGLSLRDLLGCLYVLAQVVGALRPVLLLAARVPMRAQPACSGHSAHHVPVHVVFVVLLAELGAVCLPLIVLLDEGAGDRA